jgi:hypothetical protein
MLELISTKREHLRQRKFVREIEMDAIDYMQMKQRIKDLEL